MSRWDDVRRELAARPEPPASVAEVRAWARSIALREQLAAATPQPATPLELDSDGLIEARRVVMMPRACTYCGTLPANHDRAGWDECQRMAALWAAGQVSH